MLYPRSGDRIVIIDFVASLHPRDVLPLLPLLVLTLQEAQLSPRDRAMRPVS